MMDEKLAKTVPYLLITGGAGQVIAGVEVAKAFVKAIGDRCDKITGGVPE